MGRKNPLVAYLDSRFAMTKGVDCFVATLLAMPHTNLKILVNAVGLWEFFRNF
ncbi:hypothetical protein [Helicobacter burdigaliensis]|uniref:hypothetical protein n=1 Tax=Helicobacter burdigaliensis TaxID=2315334 RepID=UPI0039EBF114